MPLDIQGTFVSQKINKVKWIPEEYVETKQFFTGSWDDSQNSVKVWSLEAVDNDEENEHPRQLSEFKIEGDVTEMKFVEKNKIAVSSSNGDVRLLEISNYEKQAPLKEVHLWNNLHKFGSEPCSCTTLDTYEGDAATVGEDGTLNILNCRRGTISLTLSADSCSLHSVCFIKHSEVITGNIRGHMKIWDIRSDSSKPMASFLLSGDEHAATCLIHHPTQPHIMIAGSESGALAIWDLRMNSFPTSLLNAHSAGVTEMQFHPENPRKLLTSSASGEVWDWNMEAITKRTTGPDNQSSTWVPLDDKTNVNVTSLMSPLHKAVNALDCDKDRILCGTDNEAVYLIKNFRY